MRVDSVEFARYRSLGDVVLRPRNLTVLVGPNNAGKSNIVDAIDFVAEAYRYGLELAVARKGPLSFRVAASITLDDMRPLPAAILREAFGSAASRLG